MNIALLDIFLIMAACSCLVQQRALSHDVYALFPASEARNMFSSLSGAIVSAFATDADTNIMQQLGRFLCSWLSK